MIDILRSMVKRKIEEAGKIDQLRGYISFGCGDKDILSICSIKKSWLIKEVLR